MYTKLKDFFLKKSTSLLYFYVLVAVIASVQEYTNGIKKFNDLPNDFTHYNNYLIFKYSFFHLLEGKDLYIFHLDEHWDLYKYSPTFALFFGVFAWMPNSVGLILWNLLNALCLFMGIRMLPKLDLEKKNLILLLSIVELFTSLQNSQSNGLIVGLVVMAFALIEKEKLFLGCLLIALTVYIKLFGLFAFAICLLYPQRWKMVGYSILSMLGLAVLPLVVVNGSQLMSIYESWWNLLQSDYIPNNLSFVGVIKAWTGISLNQNIILLIGIIMFLIPFARMKFYDQFNFRLAMLAMTLLWMIVFNHKVESPTFIIAVVGVGIWYCSTGLNYLWRTVLVLFALIFTSLSTTDVFPNFIQDNYFDPWSVKAIPCIVIYFVAFYELSFKPNQIAKQ